MTDAERDLKKQKENLCKYYNLTRLVEFQTAGSKR